MSSDGDYVQTSDEEPIQRPGGRQVGSRRDNTGDGKARAQQRWEGSLQDLHARHGIGGPIQTVEEINRAIEARKRAAIRKDVQPLQRGIIRHLVLVLDLSEAMLEKDWRPNRFIVVLKAVQELISDFFEQNPISQIAVLAMYDGKCIRVSDLSGNPTDHITSVQQLRTGDGREILPKDPEGSPSLQNALEMCRAILYHTPNHGTREVLITLGALYTNDPGDINDTIASCVKDRIRVNIIGLLARMKVCQDIVAKTNGGDDSGYIIAVDQYHFKDSLRVITAPPAIRTNEEDANMANLLIMGFPSKIHETVETFCACHGQLSSSGYICPRCESKICSLPQNCPSCGLTLILSTHLARSYHHLFPLRGFNEVSWERAKEVNSIYCKGCLKKFPSIPGHQNGVNEDIIMTDDNMTMTKKSISDGASESSRYECRTCHNHFCVDCDVFCHQTLFNCPGCHSS